MLDLFIIVFIHHANIVGQLFYSISPTKAQRCFRFFNMYANNSIGDQVNNFHRPRGYRGLMYERWYIWPSVYAEIRSTWVHFTRMKIAQSLLVQENTKYWKENLERELPDLFNIKIKRKSNNDISKIEVQFYSK